MADNNSTYTYDDVMQAICCALAFGSDAGLAARDVIDTGAKGEGSRWGVAPDRFGGILMPGAGNTIHISGEAMRLLAEADRQCDARCREIRYHLGNTTYDLRKDT